MGEYYRKNGNYYNCQIERKEYQQRGTDGIGMVHYSDTAKRNQLLDALSYLTKLDTQILAILPARRITIRANGEIISTASPW